MKTKPLIGPCRTCVFFKVKTEMPAEIHGWCRRYPEHTRCSLNHECGEYQEAVFRAPERTMTDAKSAGSSTKRPKTAKKSSKSNRSAKTKTRPVKYGGGYGGFDD